MLINYEPNTAGYLDLTFGPKWDYIPLTKNYLENFLLINMIDKVNISRIAMSASELLENAVKFSNQDGIRIMVRKLDKLKSIELIVFNYAKKGDVDDLIRLVENMNNQDSLQYYIQKMKEAAVRDDGKSGLGLPRIYHEGGAKITISFHEDQQVVEVKALFKLG